MPAFSDVSTFESVFESIRFVFERFSMGWKAKTSRKVFVFKRKRKRRRGSDLPYSYSHNVVLLSTYQVLVPSLDRITFVLNWSILPLVIPVFALENTYEKN